jgi:hypothetical protein
MPTPNRSTPCKKAVKKVGEAADALEDDVERD